MTPTQAHTLVSTIDLNAVRTKVGIQQNWDAATAERAEREYRAYLVAALVNPAKQTAPSRAADEIWHAHILDTQKYADDCKRVFGGFLHHVPNYQPYLDGTVTAQKNALCVSQREEPKDAALCFNRREEATDAALCFNRTEATEAAYCIPQRAEVTDAALCFAQREDAKAAALCVGGQVEATDAALCFNRTETPTDAALCFNRVEATDAALCFNRTEAAEAAALCFNRVETPTDAALCFNRVEGATATAVRGGRTRRAATARPRPARRTRVRA